MVFLFSSHTHSQTLKNISLSQILQKNNVLTMLQWDVPERKIFCVVTSHTETIEGDTIPFQRLNFYEKRNGRLIKIHEFEEMGFSGMFTLFDGNLMTEWVGGSAVHIKVFSVNNKGNIKIVLEEGVKTNPEFADVDEDGMLDILLSSGRVFHKESDAVKPESTRVYKWNDTSYSVIKTVPWKNRFKALGKTK